jgi:hypothetical protein
MSLDIATGGAAGLQIRFAVERKPGIWVSQELRPDREGDWRLVGHQCWTDEYGTKMSVPAALMERACLDRELNRLGPFIERLRQFVADAQPLSIETRRVAALLAALDVHMFAARSSRGRTTPDVPDESSLRRERARAGLVPKRDGRERDRRVTFLRYSPLSTWQSPDRSGIGRERNPKKG